MKLSLVTTMGGSASGFAWRALASPCSPGGLVEPPLDEDGETETMAEAPRGMPPELPTWNAGGRSEVDSRVLYNDNVRSPRSACVNRRHPLLVTTTSSSMRTPASPGT